MYPDSPLYNLSFATELTGPLDIDRLRGAVCQLVARHELLRTTFPAVDGVPYQQVAPSATVDLPVSDLVARTPAQARALLDKWADEPFDLAGGPLIRTRLIRFSPDQHVFSLVIHHLVSDGPSIHLLFDELARYYAGEPARPALTTQFGDFATWAHTQHTEPGDLDWWRRHLADVPTQLALPTDHPRPPVRGIDGATHTSRLSAELVSGATELAGRHRGTAFMVMIAAYAALLGRLSHGDRLLVGTPVSGRVFPELEPLIGYFVNTLPLRVDLSGDPTFDELVSRVRNSTLDTLSHQQVPFGELVDALDIPRDPSIPPLVQAILTFEPIPVAQPRFAGLDARLLPLSPGSAKFDLDVMITRAPDESGDFELSITYSTELFEPTTIVAFAERFRQILAAGVGDPSTAVHELPLLTTAERATVLGDWSTGGPPIPARAGVPELFACQAVATPDAAALRSGETVLSYAELDRRAGRLAGRLRADGIGVDDVVGVLLPRGIDLMVAILGIGKAGAAYLPLDPTHPSAHLATVLNQAGVGLVVTEEELFGRLASIDVTLRHVDQAADPVSVRARPDALAYVIFTSGSTGAPKGVGVSHASLANHAVALRDTFGLTSADRVLQFANVGFDVAAEEIFPTWLAGGCVVLCQDPPPPPQELSRHIVADGVTVANLPASYWQRWLACFDPATELPPPLRLLVVGSESVDLASMRTWLASTSVPVINAYGLTETTITALVQPVREDVVGDTVPVGRPIAGATAYVLDEDLEPMPIGVPGELFIGGVGLARGYLGQPALTAQRFLPDPFGSAPGGRLHRTGDRARWRADGTLEILGRLDQQLKVRGYRIEPAAVEMAMSTHPEVLQAAVDARPGPDGEARLVGYVVPCTGMDVPADLRAHLAARLPVYLVPATFMAIGELPSSASGKVNRAALPDPTAAPARPKVEAATELERDLAATWQRVLDLESVGTEDNFFDLGGTSFGLASVHAALGELIGRRLPLVTLYEYPTIAALAAHLSGPAEPEGRSHADSAARLRSGRQRMAGRRRRQH